MVSVGLLLLGIGLFGGIVWLGLLVNLLVILWWILLVVLLLLLGIVL